MAQCVTSETTKKDDTPSSTLDHSSNEIILTPANSNNGLTNVSRESSEPEVVALLDQTSKESNTSEDVLILKTITTTAPLNKPLEFKIGECLPIIRKNNSSEILLDIEPDDAIIECPSLVTPLLIKKANIWPPKIQSNQDNSIEEQTDKEKKQPEEKEQQESTNKTTSSFVRTTTVASLTNPHQIKPILAIPDYHRSSVGSFLIGLGISRANEWIIKDNIRKTKRSIRKEDNCSDLIEELERLNEQLRQTQNNNKPFTFSLIKCPHCEFKTESSTILEGHLNYPHVTSKREYRCNWCDLKTKDSKQMTFHNHLIHKRRCYIDPPLQLHECLYCPYESNSKAKSLTHIARCLKTFSESRNQAVLDESDYPAVTSKPINQEDIKIYEQTLQAIRLAAYNPNQHKLPGSLQSGSQQLLVVPRSTGISQSDVTRATNPSIRLPNINQTVINGEPLRIIGGKIGQNVATYLSNNYPRKPPSNSVPTMNSCMYGLLQSMPGSSAQLLQMFAPSNNTITKGANLNILQHPRVKPSTFNNAKSLLNANASLMMPPKANIVNNQTSSARNASYNAKSTQQTLKDNLLARQGVNNPNVPINFMNNNLHLSASKNATFVICEICDGYIKDLEQLKTHMQWIHKVKIHQKMLESRPPLNCQKCQWRFFTDQGLERHLLGAHGLVTSNMQEQVEQNTDSGRCTVCGRAYANKLVQHMKEVHKSNLKPAHLSYKCTVCSATFNLYRLFENHVYSVHSDSVKRSTSETGIKNTAAAKKAKIDFTKNASVAAVNAVIADRQNDANSNNIQASIQL